MSAAVKINKLGKFDLNPRGNLWLKDENRFGHKLLSKMGWSQGKGLGKNENGIAENLKVKMKRENTGVGWSEKVYFAEENDEYDALLANLNQKFNSSENKPKKEEDFKSIELRSQQFKNRMHYGKFVRGKDVCRYSEKDMNCIFISKKPKPEPSPPMNSSVTNIGNSSDDESPEAKPIYKKSQMSMKEYFEMKMKLKSGKVQDNNITEVKNAEESEKEGVSSKKKRKNKKRKLASEVLEDSPSKENAVDNTNLQESENEEKSLIENEVVIKKKSKSKSKDELNIFPKDTGSSDEPSGEEEMPKHSSNSAETENVNKLSSKSRKRSKTVESTEPDSGHMELSDPNKCTPIESDNVKEASWYICKSPEKVSTFTNEEGEVASKVSKKRKRKNGETKAEKRKKLKTEVVDVSEESTSDSSKKELQTGLGKFLQLQVKISDKKRKKLAAKKSKKTKLGKLAKLKSCLKGSVKYSLKQDSRRVSFNDKVFYRTINSDTEESAEELEENEVNIADNSDVKIECNGESLSCSETLETDKHNNVKMEEEDVPFCSDTSNVDEPCNVDEDSNDVPACMKLPKCDPNNYDCWLENQRIAIKMKIYKNMIKEIKKHPILRTSNMLDLKGYGNWGL